MHEPTVATAAGPGVLYLKQHCNASRRWLCKAAAAPETSSPVLTCEKACLGPPGVYSTHCNRGLGFRRCEECRGACPAAGGPVRRGRLGYDIPPRFHREVLSKGDLRHGCAPPGPHSQPLPQARLPPSAVSAAGSEQAAARGAGGAASNPRAAVQPTAAAVPKASSGSAVLRATGSTHELPTSRSVMGCRQVSE